MLHSAELYSIFMVRVFHYVNLVGWCEVYLILIRNRNPSVQHIVYCDSLSLSIVALWFGRKVERFPGPVALRNYISTKGFANCIRLTANGTDSSFKLPVFHDHVDIKDFVKNYSFTNLDILLGISSPKQNILASELAGAASVDSEFSIHCFGAAMYIDSLPERASSFFWLRFLRSDFRRSLRKIYLSFLAVLGLFSSSRRKRFLVFLSFLDRKK